MDDISFLRTEKEFINAICEEIVTKYTKNGSMCIESLDLSIYEYIIYHEIEFNPIFFLTFKNHFVKQYKVNK